MAKTKNPALEQKRKAQIIETVGRLLAEGSHRSMTLDKVAREMGVSKGMVTYYFESKDQLITEAIKHYLEQQQQAVESVIRADLPIQERLAALVNISLASRDVLEWRLRFQVEAWSFAKDVPDTFETVREAYVRFRKDCLAMLEVGIEEGFVTVPDAKWIYLLLYGLMDGISFQLVLDPSIDLEDVRTRTLDLFKEILTS